MRNLLALIVLVIVLSSRPANAEQPYAATLYKNPQCSCCEGYADYLRQSGFEVTVKPTHDLPLMKRQYLAPRPAWSACGPSKANARRLMTCWRRYTLGLPRASTPPT